MQRYLRRWIASGAAAIAIAACGRIDPHAIGTHGSPVILISIDTLRSDHLPAYGYAKVETPAIDTLRRDAILYQHAYAHCPLTLVSHASLFTGMLPSKHGIRDNSGYELAKGIRTIAEVMKSKGYATGAAVSAIVLRRETGISRGFDFWDDDIDADAADLTMGRAQRAGDETRRIAEQWIDQNKARPFFFFFHLYEPHTPWDPLPEFKARYGSTYDGDVASADAIVGRFLAYLKDAGIYDRATIILLSDHGEGLGDHGEDEHGILLYREALQVPLIIKLPRGAGRGMSVATPVQLIDVFPTISESLGIHEKRDGQSLLAKLAGRRSIYSETYYPRFHFGWSDLHSLISANDHYIEAPRPELYDLQKDLAERRNTLAENRPTYLALRAKMKPFIGDAQPPKPVDAERARQLAALGYIGSTVATRPGESLPDPKDTITRSANLKNASRAFAENRDDDAVREFQVVLKNDPAMIDVWAMYATSLERLGRYQEAMGAAKRGLTIAPRNTSLALIVAEIALQTGQLDVAEQHAKLALEDAPGDAHRVLAEVWLARNQYEEALQEAGKVATATDRLKPSALMLYGRIAVGQGDPQKALQFFDQAKALAVEHHHRPPAKLNVFRGDALARMGESEAAESAFREEIADDPADPHAYEKLVLLYVAEGRNREAADLLFALEKNAPTARSYVAIARLLKRIGDDNGAHFWAARGLKKYPRDGDLRRLMGR